MIWAVSLLTMKLIPHCLTPVEYINGIRSLVGIGTLVSALTHSVLYPHDTIYEAIPKDISERTRYRRV